MKTIKSIIKAIKNFDPDEHYGTFVAICIFAAGFLFGLASLSLYAQLTN